MTKRNLSKPAWKDAVGATKKPKRLKLLSYNGLFICLIASCESGPYRSKRGCRKHVFTKHGWYYYFEEKLDIAKVFPEFDTRRINYQIPQRVKTSNMLIFLNTCVVGVNFKKWLQGGRPRWWRKRRKSGRSVTLQSFKVFEVLLCRRLSIMGYS